MSQAHTTTSMLRINITLVCEPHLSNGRVSSFHREHTHTFLKVLVAQVLQHVANVIVKKSFKFGAGSSIHVGVIQAQTIA